MEQQVSQPETYIEFTPDDDRWPRHVRAHFVMRLFRLGGSARWEDGRAHLHLLKSPQTEWRFYHQMIVDGESLTYAQLVAQVNPRFDPVQGIPTTSDLEEAAFELNRRFKAQALASTVQQKAASQPAS